MGGGRPPKWISNYDHKFKGLIPIRQALAESRNAATIWLTKQVGIEHVITTARELGIRTPLQPYITTALGASEVDLLEMANVYRAMASGRLAEPHVIDRVTDGSGNVLFEHPHPSRSMTGSRAQLARIQEGLRGVVRIPGGTAHSLEKGADFPIPVMGKTGTTSDFRDALFVGSTFGPDGITVAVRIGFDDNRELGDRETGGRTALPVFREVMLGVYQRQLLGPPPPFPQGMEQRIAHYVEDRAQRLLAASEAAPPAPEEGAPPDVSPTPAVGDAVLAARQEAGQPVPVSLAGEEAQAAGEPVAGGSGGTTERPGAPSRRPKSE
jgi:membrane peptidoglycan carboxypeptidase